MERRRGLFQVGAPEVSSEQQLRQSVGRRQVSIATLYESTPPERVGMRPAVLTPGLQRHLPSLTPPSSSVECCSSSFSGSYVLVLLLLSTQKKKKCQQIFLLYMLLAFLIPVTKMRDLICLAITVGSFRADRARYDGAHL